MFIDVVTVDVMEVPVVEIVNVISMPNGNMTATGAVLVRMIIVMANVALSHCQSRWLMWHV